jgi:hypothetical protein
MNKRAKVHMLPTENETSIVLFPHHDINQLQCYKTKGIADKGVGQHLYFTTDEEIKVGDWVYNSVSIHTSTDSHIYQIVNKAMLHNANCRKIIASTDPKFLEPNHKEWTKMKRLEKWLPQIPQSFIEEYCKAGGIDEVDVEYGFAGLGSKKGEMFRLKVDSTHNTITIHLIKEKVYSREKVEELIHKFNKDQAGFPWHSKDALKWIYGYDCSKPKH